MVAWVAIDIVLWGFISRYLDSVAGQRVNFVASLLGAVLLWDFLGRVMQGVTTAFFEDVWSRNFLNVFATPLTISEYLSGLVATAILTSLIGLVVMLAVASLAFGLSRLKSAEDRASDHSIVAGDVNLLHPFTSRTAPARPCRGTSAWRGAARFSDPRRPSLRTSARR